MADRHVLVVDDDPKLCDLLLLGLGESGIDCTVAADGPSALASLVDPERESFDAVLLDIMMPNMSGWEVLERIRELGLGVPVIFVTAREALDERVRGLRSGADDYIIKPFAFAELLARIDAVVRRRHESACLRLSELRLDLTKRIACLRDRPVDLSPKEFDVLRLLVEARSRIVSRREMLRDVWLLQDDPGTNVVDVYIGRLRRKLAAVGGLWIRTVRGKGYSLSGASS